MLLDPEREKYLGRLRFAESARRDTMVCSLECFNGGTAVSDDHIPYCC